MDSPARQATTSLDADFPQTWNRYAYVGGTPLEATDPLGLCPGPPCVHAPGQVVGVTSTYQNVPTTDAPISNELAAFINGALGSVPSKADQGYCVTRNTPINAGWRSPNGDLSGGLDAADGPYDPGPQRWPAAGRSDRAE